MANRNAGPRRRLQGIGEVLAALSGSRRKAQQGRRKCIATNKCYATARQTFEMLGVIVFFEEAVSSPRSGTATLREHGDGRSDGTRARPSCRRLPTGGVCHTPRSTLRGRAKPLAGSRRVLG